MISSEVMQRIKQIEIFTRRIMAHVQLGSIKPVKRGAGFEFDQIRNYQVGDDVRFIDWKGSARSSELLVRQYLEERSRTIILCVDTSSSMFFSSSSTLKSELAANVAATLGLVGVYSNDSVGLVLFSDTIEQVIPPKKGKNQAYFIMNTLFEQKPTFGKKSSLDVCAQYLRSLPNKQALVFVVSDFFAPFDCAAWRSLQYKKDIVAIRCIDQQEKSFDLSALVWMQDAENSDYMLGSLGSRSIRKALEMQHATISESLKNAGIDSLDLSTHTPFIEQIISFFQRKKIS